MSEPTPTAVPAAAGSPADAITNDELTNTQVDDGPQDTVSARKKLERSLSLRPDKKELVDRNILKDSNVAPALQAAQAELQRSQLEDKLDQALLQRPNPEVLVKEGILKPDDAPLSA